jgi:hypothetical protein
MPSAVSHWSRPSTLTTMDSTSITAKLVAMRSSTRFIGFLLASLDGCGAVEFQEAIIRQSE